MFVLWNSEGIRLSRYIPRSHPPSNAHAVLAVIMTAWKLIHDFSCVLNVINLHKLISYCFRKFVYELHIHSAADDKQVLVCIEIPFRTVVGLNISTSLTVDVIMEVDIVPAMWQGKEVLHQRRDGTTCSRIQYNTLHTVDLTDGQLPKVPYHKVTHEYIFTWYNLL